MVSGITRAIGQFLQDLTFLPVDQDLDGTLKQAVEAERQIRMLFASDPSDRQLQDRYLGLVDVFAIHPAARRTRKRRITPSTTEIYDSYIFPVDVTRRRKDLMPSTVSSIEAFQQHWDIFTHGALSKMKPRDWENIVAAGGSVLACLMAPYPKFSNTTDLNEYYQSDVYGSCDIDLFLWGLSHEEAELKMMDIYRAVCAANPWPVTCVRKARTVSIHTTWPYRPIQIVLRLYQSPAEILAGFDVDAPCCAYDGNKVLVNPRCLTALIRQCNTVDLTRRSPSYEVRLAKYAKRGFEIYVPSLRRQLVKPALYSRYLWTLPQGLARLLVLELFHYDSSFDSLLKHQFFFDYDLARQSLPAGDNGGLRVVMSSYDCNLRWAQIPYGRAWDAKRIERMVAAKDAWMNSEMLMEYFTLPDDLVRPPHRHVFFAGTMERCLGSFCEECEIRDRTEDQSSRQESDPYIRGHIQFMTVNPGQQLLTGSFRPIDVGDWASEAYESRPGPQADPVETDGDSTEIRLEKMRALLSILQRLHE